MCSIGSQRPDTGALRHLAFVCAVEHIASAIQRGYSQPTIRQLAARRAECCRQIDKLACRVGSEFATLQPGLCWPSRTLHPWSLHLLFSFFGVLGGKVIPGSTILWRMSTTLLRTGPLNTLNTRKNRNPEPLSCLCCAYRSHAH